MASASGYGMKARGARKPKGGAPVTSKPSPDSGKPLQQFNITGGEPKHVNSREDSGKPKENMG